MNGKTILALDPGETLNKVLADRAIKEDKTMNALAVELILKGLEAERKDRRKEG